MPSFIAAFNAAVPQPGGSADSISTAYIRLQMSGELHRQRLRFQPYPIYRGRTANEYGIHGDVNVNSNTAGGAVFNECGRRMPTASIRVYVNTAGGSQVRPVSAGSRSCKAGRSAPVPTLTIPQQSSRPYAGHVRGQIRVSWSLPRASESRRSDRSGSGSMRRDDVKIVHD